MTTVTHELKAPLINMKQALSMVTDDKFGKDVSSVQKEYLSIIRKNVDRLMHLIRELLEVSAIDGGKMVVNRTPVSLEKIIQDSVNTVDRWCESKGIEIAIEIEKNLPRLNVDLDKLVQVFTNLLSNAIKFAPPNGRVEIKASKKIRKDSKNKKTEYVVISVTDNGPGIEEENLEKIFKRFSAVNKPTGKDFSYSTGLGLSIAKEIIKLHDGDITVSSRVNEGSTFSVFLPIEKKNN